LQVIRFALCDTLAHSGIQTGKRSPSLLCVLCCLLLALLLTLLAVSFQLLPSLARCRRVGLRCPVINTQHISGKLRRRGVAVVNLLD
jgi:hypothetical protein